MLLGSAAFSAAAVLMVFQKRRQLFSLFWAARNFQPGSGKTHLLSTSVLPMGRSKGLIHVT